MFLRHVVSIFKGSNDEIGDDSPVLVDADQIQGVFFYLEHANKKKEKILRTKEKAEAGLKAGKVDPNRVYIHFTLPGHKLEQVVLWTHVVEDGDVGILKRFVNTHKAADMKDTGGRIAFKELQRILKDETLLAKHKPDDTDEAPGPEQRMRPKQSNLHQEENVMEDDVVEDDDDPNLKDTQQNFESSDIEDAILERDDNLFDDDETTLGSGDDE